ncbi:uncharacterized protein [Lepeophtheirus salmonis]|uniref:uncharacterized protein n=1 Tax=Lepeophtheirus salmonis TaxID=72036 RepID=UPI001AEA852E|nr:uncharacterized protein LOC121117776 [Lepeophtheirus salmonis]
MTGHRELVKRKHVSVKLKRLRMPSSDSSSNGLTLNVSSMKKNNKLLARALNQSREKIRDLEQSIMSLRTENVELRVQISDLKAQVHEASEGGKNHLVNYLEPLKNIFHGALNQSVALSAEINRALTYINVPQVTRHRSSASLSNGFSSIKFAERPRNKIKKVSPMVSGHVVHKPDIKIKKLDMNTLLGTAQSQGLRFSRGEPESDPDPTRILENEDVEIEPHTENIVDLVELPEREEDEVVDDHSNDDQVKKFLTRTYQPRVSLRPFDLSLIEEEEEDELPRRRRISRNNQSDVRNAHINNKSSTEEDDSSNIIPCVDLVEEDANENDRSKLESTVSKETTHSESKETVSLDDDVVIVPKEVSNELTHPPSQSQSSKTKKQAGTATDRRETYIVKSNKTHIEEETPKSKTDISEKMFLNVIEDDPQEGPSWLFEDLFNPNKKGVANRQSSRRPLRRKASSCSKKLSFVNYCPDPRELRPYDDGSSSDDLSFDEDETYKAPPKSQSQSKLKGKRNRVDSIEKSSSTKYKRSKIEKQRVSTMTTTSSLDTKGDSNHSKSKISDSTFSEKTEENETTAAEDTSLNSSRRPKRAAAALVANMKEPSLNMKMRNPNKMGKKVKNSTSRKKSE